MEGVGVRRCGEVKERGGYEVEKWYFIISFFSLTQRVSSVQ